LSFESQDAMQTLGSHRVYIRGIHKPLHYSRYLRRLHVSTIDLSSSGIFLSFESQDAMHTLGSHRVYTHGIHKIKSFVSEGVTYKLCSQQWGT